MIYFDQDDRVGPALSRCLVLLVVVVCVDVLAVLEVTGHVGEDVSIHCSGNWTTENSSEHFNLYFCKGICSRENTVIQTPRETAAIVQMGRYSLQALRGDGAFKVNIMKLKMADTGQYYCGAGTTVVLYQEVSLKVQNDGTFMGRFRLVQGKLVWTLMVCPVRQSSHLREMTEKNTS